MIQLVLLVFLTIMAVEDVLHQEVSSWIIYLTLIILTLIRFLGEGYGIREFVGDSFLGAFLLIYSKCTKECIGYGDGLILVVIGIALGPLKTGRLFFSGCIIAGIIAALGCLSGKLKRGVSLPFIPCLWSCYVWEIWRMY